ncbi:MAG: cytochrome P450 [Candidatus Binatia bacterium]
MGDHPVNPEIRLADGAFYAADPHRHFQWMREHAPVYWDEAAQAWGITRYDDVLAVAKDPKTFCSSGGIRPDAPAMPYMIDTDDPEHKQRRGLVNKGFTLRRVQEHEPRIRAVAAELIERAKARGRFDFVKDVAAWLPLIVIGDMLGVAPADHERLLQWSDDMVCGTGATSLDRVQRASAAFDGYIAYQREVIADRRAKPPQDDLVSILVHAEIDGERLGDNELLMETLLILIGGDETTRHVISGGMYQLLRHPQQRQKLIDDASKIPTAVEEMLRWVTPIQNMARTATRDVVLRGQTIRAGQKVLLLYPSANRDAAVFADPFRFDVERTPNEHLAFGFGAHFCLGASLARLELRVMFEEILRRMPQLELASEEPPPWRASNFICGIEALPVRVDGEPRVRS